MRIVYVVDDDEIVRSLAHQALSECGGIHLFPFVSGDAFVAALDELEVGVVLLDIHMPGMSGIDVLKHVAATGRGFKTIVMTAQAQIPLAVDAMKLGALDFIEKPFECQSLAELTDRAFIALQKDFDDAAPRDQARARIARLSAREREVLAQLVEGSSNRQVAQALGVSPRTVEIHRANIMTKLDLDSLVDVVRLSLKAELLEAA